MVDKRTSAAVALVAILLLAVPTVFIAGSQSQGQTDFIPYPGQASTNNDNIEMAQASRQGLLESIVNMLPTLSSVSAPDQVDPGNSINFDVSAEAQQDFNLGGKVKIVEIYDCHDSSCDNGDFVEAKSSYTAFDADVNDGTEYAWTVTYTTPSDAEGYYAATGYLSDGNGNVLTDTPRHVFFVGSKNTDGGSTGGDGSDGDDGSGGSEGSTNKPPEVQSIDAPVVVNTSETFRIQVQASDPEGQSLSYSWSNGKSGESIILSYEEAGVKELDVEVSDGEKSVTSTVRVKVRSSEVVVDPKQPDDVGFFQGLINWYLSLFS